MKKSIVFLFILASILSACLSPSRDAPQVTATSTSLPTETPIPTPTVHPQFAEIQELIDASGGRFTLQADGTIQDGTEIVPGIIIAPDGTITLVVDSEGVILDPADVTFDEENGFSVNGYELDEYEDWVLAESPEVTAAKSIFGEYEYSTDGVEFRVGEVTTSGYVDGVKVFEQNNKSGAVLFDENFAKEQASQMKLDPSDLGPREDILEATGQYFIDQSSWDPIDEEYVDPLIKQYEAEYGVNLRNIKGDAYSWIMLDKDINAWGTILELNYKDPNAPRYLYYRDEAGKGYLVPLMPAK